MVGQDARRARASREVDAAPRRGEGGVFPFAKFPGVDTHPRPRDALDRRGDGHRRATSPRAFAKAQLAAGTQAADARHARSVACATTTSRPRVEVARRLVRARLRASSPPTAPRRYFARAGVAVRRHQQGARGPPALRRRDRQRRDRHGRSTRPRARRRSRTRSRSAAPRSMKGIPYYTTIARRARRARRDRRRAARRPARALAAELRRRALVQLR